MRRLMLVPIIVFLLSLTSAAAPQGVSSADQVASALQTKYDTIKDFTADFVQQYKSGALRKNVTERGKLQVKKPGKMRWDYADPEKKVFVSDGSTIYFWVPADNQVTKSRVPKQDEATTALLFLVGKGNITRDFKVSFTPSAPAGTYGLRLDPKLAQRDYDWLELIVDRSTLQIRGLTAADRQGGQSTFSFSNFKENVGLSDKPFAFQIPRGADVKDAGASSR
jgi:outer membrane lipoprotein carrier protein